MHKYINTSKYFNKYYNLYAKFSMKKKPADNLHLNKCQVCKLPTVDNHIFEKITCKECTKTVHKFCYAPDLKDHKAFKCDECKKGKEGKCEICMMKGGILKQTGQKTWAHVICALSSPKITLISYKNLQFKVNPKQTNDNPVQKICFICKIRSADVFQCCHQSCKSYAHINCILSHSFPSGLQSYLTFSMLDKHNYCLLNHLSDYTKNFQIYDFYKMRRKTKMIVCPEHNDDPHFIFCTCNRGKMKSKNQPRVTQVFCQKCHRWFHLACTALKDIKQDFICVGCKQNNFFKKSVQFPELIQKMNQIQTKSKLDKQIILLLDSFIFKLSQVIIQICLKKKNAFQIDRFFLKKSLDRYVRDEKDYKQNKQKSKTPKIISNQGKIIQMFYYLWKEQRKSLNDITFDEIQDLSLFVKNKKNGINFDNDVENRYLLFFQNKLKSYQTDDQRDNKILLISMLKKFITKNKQEECRQPQKIYLDLKQILKFIEKCQYPKTIFSATKASPKNMIQFIYKSKLNDSQVIQIFKNYRKIIQLKLTNKAMTFSQSQHLMSTNKQYNISQSKRKILMNLFTNQLKHITIQKEYEEKYQQMSRCQVILKNKETNYSQIKEMKQRMVSKGVFFSLNSPMVQHQNNWFQLQIKRLRLMNQMKNPNLDQIEMLIGQIKSFLQQCSNVHQLNENDRRQLSKFQIKYYFYSSLINYHKQLKSQQIQQKLHRRRSYDGYVNDQKQHRRRSYDDYVNEQQQISNLSLMQCQEEDEKCLNLDEQVQKIVSRWDKHENSIKYGFDILHKISLSKTQLLGQQLKVMQYFAQKIFDQLQRKYQYNPKQLTFKHLDNIYKILKYIKIQMNYSIFIQWYQDYNKWKLKIEKFIKIQECLENYESIGQLLEEIQNMLNQTSNVVIDIASEERKLNILRIWAKTSEKFLSQQKQNKKFTITSIQKFKQNMDKINYPKNAIRKTIDDLELQSKTLNKKISKFLQKNKFVDVQLCIFEQLKYLHQKMSIIQAQSLLNDLKNSALDVSIQSQQLQEHIKIFRSLPSSLKNYSESARQSLSLLQLRKTLLQNSFKYEPLSQYVYLFQKIHELKCSEYNGSTCYKQYMKMLEHGGLASIELSKKTPQLLNAYKFIEKAKKQILLPKPRPEYLLPLDFKRLRSDIKDDTFETQNIQKYYMNYHRLKDTFNRYKQSKASVQYYYELINELRLIPINSCHIQDEFKRMIKEIQDLCVKVNFILQDTSNINWMYCQDMIDRYNKNGIKSDVLQKFSHFLSAYKEIIAISKDINLENYRHFNFLCQSHPGFQRIYQLKTLRFQKFHKIYQQYFNEDDGSLQVGLALINQGSYLFRGYDNNAKDILMSLLQLNKKIFQIDNQQHEQFDIEQNITEELRFSDDLRHEGRSISQKLNHSSYSEYSEEENYR